MLRFPIVGMYYRPPAEALIKVIAIGTPLLLRAEPDNPADPNAVSVWLRSSDLTAEAKERLETELGTMGYTVADILAREEWQLGYIPKNMAAEVRSNGTIPLDAAIDGVFRCADNGGPRVTIEA